MVGLHELCRETKVLVSHKIISCLSLSLPFFVITFKDKQLQDVVSSKVGFPYPLNATITLNASAAGSRPTGSFQPICHHPPRLLILFTLQRCWNNQRLCPHPSSSSSLFIEDVAGLWYIIQRSRIMQKIHFASISEQSFGRNEKYFSLVFFGYFFACPSFKVLRKRACSPVMSQRVNPPFLFGEW